MCHANNEKRKNTNNGRNRTTKPRKNQSAWRKGKLQVLDNIGGGHYQISEDKRKIAKEYHRRTIKLLKTKLCGRNFIIGIKIRIVPLVRYLGPFLKWTREELKEMDQRTRNQMMMYKVLHPRDDIDRYMSRKERVTGSIEDSVDTSIWKFQDYIKKRKEWLITATRSNTNNIKINRKAIAWKYEI